MALNGHQRRERKDLARAMNDVNGAGPRWKGEAIFNHSGYNSDLDSGAVFYWCSDPPFGSE